MSGIIVLHAFHTSIIFVARTLEAAPLKSKLAELKPTPLHFRRDQELHRDCERKGADHIAEEFIAEADRLAKQRQDLEL